MKKKNISQNFSNHLNALLFLFLFLFFGRPSPVSASNKFWFHPTFFGRGYSIRIVCLGYAPFTFNLGQKERNTMKFLEYLQMNGGVSISQKAHKVLFFQKKGKIR